MKPGAEDLGGQGQADAALTEKLKNKLGKAHDRLEGLGMVGPSADIKIAERARAFVAKLRSGRPFTMAEISAEVDALCADVQAHDAPKVAQPGPIDPVQTA